MQIPGSVARFNTIPLTHKVSLDEYMEVLEQRQAAYMAEYPPNPNARLFVPPLLEWFVREEDEAWVKLPAQEKLQPKTPRKPRQYRSAESLRAELDDVERRMAAIAGTGRGDRAEANLSPLSRSRAAATAGRRRFAAMDRQLEEYARLARRRDALNSRIASAERREAA